MAASTSSPRCFGFGSLKERARWDIMDGAVCILGAMIIRYGARHAYRKKRRPILSWGTDAGEEHGPQIGIVIS